MNSIHIECMYMYVHICDMYVYVHICDMYVYVQLYVSELIVNHNSFSIASLGRSHLMHWGGW